MAWDMLDFAVFGALVAAAAIAFHVTTRLTNNSAFRAAVAVALAGAFILVWVNGAVGIIGDASNDANLLYFGVLAVGAVGSFLTRFKPRGMAHVLAAMTVAQALVAVAALVAGWGANGPSWPADVVVLTGFFMVLWLLSAWLFRLAGRQTGESIS
jgi:hypothetical protein